MTETDYYATTDESCMNDGDLIRHLQEKIVRLTAHTDQVEAMAAEGYFHVATSQALLARLREQEEYAQSQVENLRGSLSEARQRHQRDIAHIGGALLDTANDHGWCDEFDRFVDDVNGDLLYELETRRKDYSVTFTVTMHVEANSDDNAAEMAESDMRACLRQSDYSADYNLDDISED